MKINYRTNRLTVQSIEKFVMDLIQANADDSSFDDAEYEVVGGTVLVTGIATYDVAQLRAIELTAQGYF
jgi:hypothetical protein